MRRLLPLLVLLAPAPAFAQTDPGAELRLRNQLRWSEGRFRDLQADLGALRTDQAVRGLQAERLPDPVLTARQRQLDAVAAESLDRARQAASTARAAGLRAVDPAYDQRLRALGFATGLPVGPRP